MVRRQTKPAAALIRYLPVLTALTIGFVIGWSLRPHPAQLPLATAEQKEHAVQEISRLYRAANTTGCSDPSDPKKLQDRIAVFTAYLRVNSYANRAVMRGCNNADYLLAKTKAGSWVRTNVSLALDARVNARWQQECLIQDITVTDTEIRPENTSLDNLNFEECRKIRGL